MTARSNTMAARLREVRAELDLSQPQIAALMRISLRAYQTYEAGERQPKAGDVASLAEVGIDLTWLLTGIGQMRRDQPVTQPHPPQPTAPNVDVSARITEIHNRFMNTDQQPTPELREELQAFAHDPAISNEDRATVDMILDAAFHDEDAERRKNQRFNVVLARARATTDLLNAATKALSWKPPPVIWLTLQTLAFKYRFDLEDLISLYSALKSEADNPTSLEDRTQKR